MRLFRLVGVAAVLGRSSFFRRLRSLAGAGFQAAPSAAKNMKRSSDGFLALVEQTHAPSAEAPNPAPRPLGRKYIITGTEACCERARERRLAQRQRLRSAQRRSRARLRGRLGTPGALCAQRLALRRNALPRQQKKGRLRRGLRK